MGPDYNDQYVQTWAIEVKEFGNKVNEQIMYFDKFGKVMPEKGKNLLGHTDLEVHDLDALERKRKKKKSKILELNLDDSIIDTPYSRGSFGAQSPLQTRDRLEYGFDSDPRRFSGSTTDHRRE